MAGVKGKSGGARPGAGRKPKPKPEIQQIQERDMLQLLKDIALGRIPDVTPLQVRAAVAAVQYTHAKVGEGGKKEQKNDAAKSVASKFAPRTPPRLVAMAADISLSCLEH